MVPTIFIFVFAEAQPAFCILGSGIEGMHPSGVVLELSSE